MDKFSTNIKTALVTGIAILHNDFMNFDIIAPPYFLFLQVQPEAQFQSHNLIHLA